MPCTCALLSCAVLAEKYCCGLSLLNPGYDVFSHQFPPSAVVKQMVAHYDQVHLLFSSLFVPNISHVSFSVERRVPVGLKSGTSALGKKGRWTLWPQLDTMGVAQSVT